MGIPAKTTGLHGPGAQLGAAPDAAPDRPLSLSWITEELIAEHRRVWSKYYRRPVSRAEALEIIQNLRRFAEVMLQASRERSGT